MCHIRSRECRKESVFARRKSAGFTLIELLVVIAIIAVLAAILFPVFTAAKENANTTKCLNNLMQLGRGFRMYLDDWHRFPAVGTANQGLTEGGVYAWVENPTSDTGNAYTVPTKSAIWSYVKNEKLFVCPSDKSQWRISSVTRRKFYFGLSYSMNYYLEAPLTPNGPTRVMESDVAHPTTTVLLIDEGSQSASGTGKIIDGRYQASADPATDVHNHGCNFAFVDGHAKWIQHNKYTALKYFPRP